MINIPKLAEKYGRLIGGHPILMLSVVILLTLSGMYGNSLVQQEIQDNSDMIPDTYQAIWALNYIGDEFGGTESGTIVIEIDPQTPSSTEIRDVRDSKVLEYADILAKQMVKLEEITSASTAADGIKQDGRIPKTQRDIRNALDKNPFTTSYVSNDYSMTLVRLDFTDGILGEEIYPNLQRIITSTPKPAGIKSTLSGDFAVDVSISEQMGPDMQKTSQASMIGVLFVIIMLFRSLRYGLTSLSAILFGVIWTFGLFGLLGISVTNMTSGAASMIMGIGIDFGIQVSSRFRIEYKLKNLVDAMGDTIRAVSIPMGTTTLAALIGFKAMSMGELKVLGDLAQMMSLGTLCCMLAALTVVPVAIVLGEKIFGEKK